MRDLGLRLIAPSAVGVLILVASANAFAAEPPLTVQQILQDCNTVTDYCAFHPYGPPTDGISGAYQEASTSVSNCTASDIAKKFTVSNTTSTTESVSLEASVTAKLEGVFEASLKTTYSYAWTESVGVTDETDMTVKVHEVGQIYFQPQLVQVTGSYEVHYGKRHAGHYYWFANNITWTGPSPTRRGGFVPVTQPMTPQQVAACPKIPSSARGGGLTRLGIKVNPGKPRGRAPRVTRPTAAPGSR